MKFTNNKLKKIVWEKLSLKVKTISRNTRGWEMDVWIMETDKQKIVFKHPMDNRKVRNSHAIAYKLLAKKGIIVPQILYIDDQILIETFLDGTYLEQIDFSKVPRYEVFLKIGEVFKKIHSIKTTNFGMITDEPLVGKFSTQIEYLQSGLSDELLVLEKTPYYSRKDVEQVLQYFESHKSVVKNSSSVLLHADFCGSNLVYTPDGEIGMIDFADLSVGNPMFDVTKVYTEHIGDGSFQAFKDGYGAIQLEQVKLFALRHLIFLIPALWKRNDEHDRVKRLCQVFETIWK